MKTLKKSITMTTLLGSAIAGIIGSGWLLGPFACAKIAGPASVLCWLIAGLLMMIVAATFVLLTRAMPIVGGTVRFFQISYGHFAGYSFAWIAWLAWVAVTPVETMAMIQYSSSYIPGLMTVGAAPVLTVYGMTVAMLCMAVITCINSYGVQLYSRMNGVVLVFKIMIPVMTVIILLSHNFHMSHFTGVQGFMPYGIKSLFAALPLAGVIYSFIGFNPAIQMAAESKNPQRDIAIAVFGSLIVCMVLYVLVQMVFIAAVPFHAFSHGWASLSFAGDRGPFVGLLTGMGMVWFVKVLVIDATVSPFGTAMVQAMATSRLSYAMAENKYFPKLFMTINRHGSPARAILFNMIIGFAFFLPFPSWQHMVGFLVSCLVLGYVVGPMSLMIIAEKNPDCVVLMSKSMLHILCIVAFYICNLMIFWSGWDVVYKMMILFSIGYVVLAFQTIFSHIRIVSVLDMLQGSWVIVYMIGMAVISYLGSFGGQHMIPFGMDFIVIAVFSISIYAMAYYVAVAASWIRAPIIGSQVV